MSATPLAIDVTEEAKRRAAIRIRNSYGSGANALYDATQITGNRRVIPFNTQDSKKTINRYTRLQGLSLGRWAYANEGFTKGAVDSMSLYAISTGFTPLPQDPDPANNVAHASNFVEWSKVGNVDGTSLEEDLDLICKAIDVDGGVGMLLCETSAGFPQYQLWEAHRIGSGPGCAEGSPNSFTAVTPAGDTVTVQGTIWDGVTIDEIGRPVGYRLLTDAFGSFVDVPAWNFIYIGERTRTGEPQCMTNLIHALPDIQDMLEIKGLSKQLVKTTSTPTLVIYSNEDGMPLAPSRHRDNGVGELPGCTSPDASEPYRDPTREELQGGLIPRMRPGEKLEAHTPSVVTPGLTEFNEVLCRPISLGLGFPLQFIYKPEEIKAAASRLITTQVKRRIRKRQRLLILRLLNRLYFWVTSKSINNEEIPSTKEPWKILWQLPQDITVDAGRDAVNDRADIVSGQRTYQEDYGERNMDWKASLRQKAIEAQFIQELSVEFKVPVDRIAANNPNPASSDAPSQGVNTPPLSQ